LTAAGIPARIKEMAESEYYWLYILQVKNGYYYTGYTSNLKRRYKEHVRGTCKYTRAFPPMKIARSWKIFADRGMLLKIESLIKRQRRKGKTLLINNTESLEELVWTKLSLKLKIENTEAAYIKAINLKGGDN
jgi:putative endonuclease